MKGRGLLLGVAVVVAVSSLGTTANAGIFGRRAPAAGFSFDVTCDMREFASPEYQNNSSYFQGTCEAVRDVGAGEFMVSPGDIDPPRHVYEVIRAVLGDDYAWYPVVGNHEAETPEDMAWLRDYNPGGLALPRTVHNGPPGSEETTYSWSFGNAHFVSINQYYDGATDAGADGVVLDELYYWLAWDLSEAESEHVFVFGHEPIVAMPDMDNGRVRHQGDSLDQYPRSTARFVNLLRKHNAVYVCGHTHNATYGQVNGVWQIDAGHCRGLGDRGARSTFVKMRVAGPRVTAEFYRDDAAGGPYELVETVIIKE